MNALQVIQHGGVQVVDSREVARMVERNHKDLLRDIRGYIDVMETPAERNFAPSGTERNFAPSDFFIPSTYTDSTGRTLPCYLLTKKGCDMVANKMTGEKGVLFTAAYVTAFEAMRNSTQANEPLVRSRKSADEIAAEGKRAQAMLLNAKNRTAARLQKLYDRAGVKAEYQALAIEELFAEDGVRLPRIALSGAKITYDKGTIADKLGILSKNGKPHAYAVGAIIAQISIPDSEKEMVPYCHNGHDGVDYQYTDAVIKKVDEWLAQKQYPTKIEGGSGKTYAVKYRSLA